LRFLYFSIYDLHSFTELNFYLIGYESLCTNSKVWVNIKNLLSINHENKLILKETKNVIGQTFNKNLAGKCYNLYESLVSKSFGT
jgi:hypothetical protein